MIRNIRKKNTYFSFFTLFFVCVSNLDFEPTTQISNDQTSLASSQMFIFFYFLLFIYFAVNTNSKERTDTELLVLKYPLHNIDMLPN